MRQFLIAAVLTVGVLAGVDRAVAKPAASTAECRSVCGAKIAADCSGLRKHKTVACKAREVRQCRKVGTAAWCPTSPISLLSPECTRTPSSLPTELTLTVPLFDPNNPSLGNGSDLDNGVSGVSQNFPILGGTSLKYCLNGCDGTGVTTCTGTGTTGDNSLNGPTFGAPLPLIAATIPVCVVNRFQESTITNTFDLATGQSTGDVKLFSDVYITGSAQEVCPRCLVSGGNGTIGSQGTCSSSARNAGASCTVSGIDYVAQGAGNPDYLLAGECIPPAGALAGTLGLDLPLTTETAQSAPGPLPCKGVGQTQDDACAAGTCTAACTGNACVAKTADGRCIDAKGGISQVCCSSNTSLPCFPTRNGGTIERSGKRATDGQSGAFAATFCIAPTQSTTVNITSGLPGPGAMILPVQVSVLPKAQ